MYFVTILWEKCTFIVFQYSVLCLINDNSSLCNYSAIMNVEYQELINVTLWQKGSKWNSLLEFVCIYLCNLLIINNSLYTLSLNSYSANFPFILILHVVIVVFCVFHDLFLSLQLNGNYSYSDTPLKPFRTEKLSLYTLMVLHECGRVRRCQRFLFYTNFIYLAIWKLMMYFRRGLHG